MLLQINAYAVVKKETGCKGGQRQVNYACTVAAAVSKKGIKTQVTIAGWRLEFIIYKYVYQLLVMYLSCYEGWF